jgi:hypothetical protein
VGGGGYEAHGGRVSISGYGAYLYRRGGEGLTRHTPGRGRQKQLHVLTTATKSPTLCCAYPAQVDISEPVDRAESLERLPAFIWHSPPTSLLVRSSY